MPAPREMTASAKASGRGGPHAPSPPAVVKRGAYAPGPTASTSLVRFVRVFSPLASPTPEGRRLREETYKRADNNGSGNCSLSEINAYVRSELGRSYGASRGRALFDEFKPAYLHAFRSASALDGSAGDDSTIGPSEFRLLHSYLTVFAGMVDAFGIIDDSGRAGRGEATTADAAAAASPGNKGGGGGRHSNEWSLPDFLAGYGKVRGHGFEELRSLTDDGSASEAFSRMAVGDTGTVTLGRFCDHLKRSEIDKDTALGNLFRPPPKKQGLPKKVKSPTSWMKFPRLAAKRSDEDLSVASEWSTTSARWDQPGSSSSRDLVLVADAFQPILSGTSEREWDASDATAFASAVLWDAHGDEEGERLAESIRVAVLRAATHGEKDDDGDAPKGEVEEGGGATEQDEAQKLAKRIVAAAGMLDALRRLDGGLSSPSGEGGDLRIQLSEWIYGYLSLRGCGFVGLPKNEKEAKAAFDIMRGDDDEVDYDGWCDYFERREVQEGTELGALLRVPAEEVTTADGKDKAAPAAAQVSASALFNPLGSLMGGGAGAAPTAAAATTAPQQDEAAKNKKSEASVSGLFNPLGSLLKGSAAAAASPAQDDAAKGEASAAAAAAAPKTLLVGTIAGNEGGDDDALERGAPDASAKPRAAPVDAGAVSGNDGTATDEEAAALRAEVIDLRKKLDESKSDGEAARRDRAAAEEDATTRRTEVADLRTALEESRGDGEAARQDQAAAEKEATSLRTEVTDLRTALDDARKEGEAARKEGEAALKEREAAAETEVASLRAEVARLQKALADAERDSEAARKEQEAAAERMVASLRSEISNLQKALDDCRKEREAARKAHEAAAEHEAGSLRDFFNQKIAELEDELQKSRRESEAELSDLQRALGVSMRDSKAAIAEREAAAAKESALLQAQVATLQKDLDDSERAREIARKERQVAAERQAESHRGEVADLRKTLDRTKRENEAARKEREASAEKEAESHREEIANLRKALDDTKRDNEAAREALEAAAENEAISHRAEVAKLNKALGDTKRDNVAAMKEGEAIAKKEAESHRAEVSSLNEALEEANSKHESLKKELDLAVQLLHEDKAEAEKMRAEAAEAHRNEKERALEQQRSDLALTHRREMDELQNSLKAEATRDQEKVLHNLRTKLTDEHRREMEISTRDGEAARKKWEAAEKEANSLRENHRREMDALRESAREEAALLSTELGDAHDRELDKLRSEVRELKAVNASLRATVAEAEREANAARVDREGSMASLRDQLRSTREELEEFRRRGSSNSDAADGGSSTAEQTKGDRRGSEGGLRVARGVPQDRDGGRSRQGAAEADGAAPKRDARGRGIFKFMSKRGKGRQDVAIDAADGNDESTRTKDHDSIDYPEDDENVDSPALSYLVRYEKMVRLQNEEQEATIAHLWPLFERLRALADPFGREDKGGRSPPPAVDAEDNPTALGPDVFVSYAALARALRALEGDKAGGENEEKDAASVDDEVDWNEDTQLVMVIKALMRSGIDDDTEGGAPEQNASNTRDGLSNHDGDLSFPEFVQCYKTAVEGTLTLQMLPGDDSSTDSAKLLTRTRHQIEKRNLELVQGFGPSVMPPQNKTRSLDFGAVEAAPQSKSRSLDFGEVETPPQSKSRSLDFGVAETPPQSKSRSLEIDSAETAPQSKSQSLSTGTVKTSPSKSRRILRGLLLLALLASILFLLWLLYDHIQGNNDNGDGKIISSSRMALSALSTSGASIAAAVGASGCVAKDIHLKEVTDLRQELSSCRAEAAGAKSKSTEQSSKIQHLEKTISLNESKLRDSNQSLSMLRAEVNGLTTKETSHLNKIRTLEKSYAGCESKLEDAQQSLSKMVADSSAHTSKISESEISLRRIQAEAAACALSVATEKEAVSKLEQERGDAEAARDAAKAEARASDMARGKAESNAAAANKDRAKAEEEARAAQKVKVKAEEEAQSARDARAKAEEEARAAQKAKIKAEEETQSARDARAKAEEEARAAQKAKTKAEEDTQSANDARAKLEAQAKSDAKLAAETQAACEKNRLEAEAKAAAAVEKAQVNARFAVQMPRAEVEDAGAKAGEAFATKKSGRGMFLEATRRKLGLASETDEGTVATPLRPKGRLRTAIVSAASGAVAVLLAQLLWSLLGPSTPVVAAAGAVGSGTLMGATSIEASQKAVRLIFPFSFLLGGNWWISLGRQVERGFDLVKSVKW